MSPVLKEASARAVATLCSVTASTLGRQAAQAITICGSIVPRVICSELGVLEAALVDEGGRLFFSNQTRNSLMRMDDPDAEPIELVSGITSPGGLALHQHRRQIIVGFGNSLHGGLLGNTVGLAGLFLVDPDTGEKDTWVKGLGMANGVASDTDGTVYASNDLGTHIDRIDANGIIEPRWARVWSANGLAVDPSGTFLYAAQTFASASIVRVEIANPKNVTIHARAPHIARFSALDGLAIDDQTGRLYVAANGAGQIWRVEPDGSICALARGLTGPSAIALGRGQTGFRAGNVYVVTFAGEVIELPGGTRVKNSS